jgi:hypothetical protein
MSAPIGPLTAAQADETLGDQCPECGWTRGRHRPGGAYLVACERGERA